MFAVTTEFHVFSEVKYTVEKYQIFHLVLDVHMEYDVLAGIILQYDLIDELDITNHLTEPDAHHAKIKLSSQEMLSQFSHI